MKTQEFTINKASKINIQMEDDNCFDDYIVAGYSTFSYSKNIECRKQKRKERRANRKKERQLVRKIKNQKQI